MVRAALNGMENVESLQNLDFSVLKIFGTANHNFDFPVTFMYEVFLQQCAYIHKKHAHKYLCFSSTDTFIYSMHMH